MNGQSVNETASQLAEVPGYLRRYAEEVSRWASEARVRRLSHLVIA